MAQTYSLACDRIPADFKAPVISKLFLMLNGKPQTAVQLADRAGVPIGTVRTQLSRLVRDGVVNKLGKGDDYDSQSGYDIPAGSPDSETVEALNSLLKDAQEKAAEAFSAYLAELENTKKKEELIVQLQAESKDNVKTITIVDLDGTKREFDGDTTHKQLPKLIALANARANIYLYGPTGSGKTTVAAQVAEALGLDFYFTSASGGMSEGVITGRLLPVGKGGKFEYVSSEFVKAYENGGVFLLDEMDAADENVMLVINSALANGELPLPNRPEAPYAKRHADFVMIGAGNTVGTGADRQYSGRNQQDGATLDRFAIGKVMIDYDTRIESAICPNEKLLEVCHTIRRNINSNRLQRAMSTRFIADATKMVEHFGWSIEDALESYFLGWREDEVAKARQGIRF